MCSGQWSKVVPTGRPGADVVPADVKRVLEFLHDERIDLPNWVTVAHDVAGNQTPQCTTPCETTRRLHRVPENSQAIPVPKSLSSNNGVFVVAAFRRG
ncbi:hypothetical protein DIRU0_D18118 [Diutina rugosa]